MWAGHKFSVFFTRVFPHLFILKDGFVKSRIQADSYRLLVPEKKNVLLPLSLHGLLWEIYLLKHFLSVFKLSFSPITFENVFFFSFALYFMKIYLSVFLWICLGLWVFFSFFLFIDYYYKTSFLFIYFLCLSHQAPPSHSFLVTSYLPLQPPPPNKIK